MDFITVNKLIEIFLKYPNIIIIPIVIYVIFFLLILLKEKLLGFSSYREPYNRASSLQIHKNIMNYEPDFKGVMPKFDQNLRIYLLVIKDAIKITLIRGTIINFLTIFALVVIINK